MLAKRLHIKVVAEGIETIEQAKAMKNKGIEYLQGYLFSPPVSGDVFIHKWILSTEKGAIRCVIHRHRFNFLSPSSSL